MIVAVDVDYRADCVSAAFVAFDEWAAAWPSFEGARTFVGAAAPYEPGRFFRREVPYLVALLADDARLRNVAVVVIDGYVWLGDERPGLGAVLHDALGARTPVVGVAKKSFHQNTRAIPVLRGDSLRPLFVTAVGIDARDAARAVARMHGAHRIPTLLRRADQRARKT